MSAQRFDDQVVIVTGAGAGLGRAYAHLLASLGARVVVNDYGGTVTGERGTLAAADAVVAEITEAGGTAVANGADISDPNAGTDLVAQAMDTWGRIDAIINNAGSTRGGVGVEQNSVEDLMFTLNIHVAGTARLVSAAWKHMSAAGYGRIVNTSSDSIWGTPSANYVTAKAAVFGYTRAVAAEAGPLGIKVNTILPSAWTRMTGQLPPGDFRDTVERHFPPERAAPFVALLAHRDCPWNGEAFQIGANRAAHTFLAATTGFKAGDDDPLGTFTANADAITDTNNWYVPDDMGDSVAHVIADLQGDPQ